MGDAISEAREAEQAARQRYSEEKAKDPDSQATALALEALKRAREARQRAAQSTDAANK